MVGPSPVVLSQDGRFAACEATPAPYYPSIPIHSVYQVDFETLVPCGAEFFPICADGLGRSCPQALPVAVDPANRKSIPSQAPAISSDGSRVAFRFPQSFIRSLRTRVAYSIAVADMNSGQVRSVLPLPKTQVWDEDLVSTSLRFASEGAHLFFDTDRTDLIPEDQNLASDVFRFEIRTGSVDLLSQRDPSLSDETTGRSVDLALGGSSQDSHAIAFFASEGNLNSDRPDGLPKLLVRDEFARQTSPIVSYRGGNTVSTNPAGLQSVGISAVDFAISDSGRHLVYLVTPSDFPQFVSELRWLDRADGKELKLNQPSAVLPYSREAGPFGKSVVQPSISTDGSKIVFVAFTDKQTFSQGIFLADLNQWALSGPTNVLVSVGDRLPRKPLVYCGAPRITKDGSRVFFLSTDSTLSPQAVQDGQTNLFVRDLARGKTDLCSRSLLNQGLENQVVLFSVSDNRGSRVAYWTRKGDGFVYDVLQGTERQVCSQCQDLQLSADGVRVAYLTQGAAIDGKSQVFADDLAHGDHWLVSESKGGLDQPGDADSSMPQITPDGRWVIFASRAGDLVEGDDNHVSDLFLRDLAERKTLLLTRSHAGPGAANGSSTRPHLSIDGSTVVFRSFASDLIEGDFNSSQDLFALRLRDNDTDKDGLPDDWERALLGTLDSRPSDDGDGDGATNEEEWMAGTNPTDARSVLKIQSFQPATGQAGGVLIGTGAPWHRYQLQERESAASGVWRDAGEAVVASPDGLIHPVIALPPSTSRFLRFIEKP